MAVSFDGQSLESERFVVSVDPASRAHESLTFAPQFYWPVADPGEAPDLCRQCGAYWECGCELELVSIDTDTLTIDQDEAAGRFQKVMREFKAAAGGELEQVTLTAEYIMRHPPAK